MMESRRMPKPKSPSTKSPLSSGPRCTMRSHCATMVSRATGRRPLRYQPAMPHMFRSAAPCTQRAQFLLETLDPLEVAENDADGVRIELEIAADARGRLGDDQGAGLERPRRRLRIARHQRAVADEL